MKIITAHRSSQSYITYPYHNHTLWEFIVGLTGSGTAWIDGEPFAFDEETVLCIPPGVQHCKTSDNGYTDGNIFIADFIPPHGTQLYLFQDDALGSFRHIFNMANHFCLVGAPNAKGILEALSEMLFQLFISRCSPDIVINQAVERFQNVLLNNFQEAEFDLAKAEEVAGYSRSYFRKVFKASTGLSPSAYLQKIRIDFAKRQMRQFRKSCSIGLIAEFSGFSDPDYFSRVFHKLEGMSPREYAKSLGRMTIDDHPAKDQDHPESVYWLELQRKKE